MIKLQNTLSATLATISLIALAACTTTRDANKGLNLRYLGTPADGFFVRHGPPASKHELDSGERLYVWAEHPTVHTVPGSTNTKVSLIGNVTYADTITVPASSYAVQCQVKLITSSEGIIQHIEAHGDTIGHWEASRCAEIFRVR